MPQFLSRFIRYGFTGGVAAVIDLSMFLLLLHMLPIGIAAIISFFLAAAVNYRLSSRYVFDENPEISQFVRFLGGAIIGVSVNVGITILASARLSFPPTYAKLLGIAVAFSLNFAINQIFVFVPRGKR